MLNRSDIVVSSETSLMSPYYENELILKPNNKISLLPLHLQVNIIDFNLKIVFYKTSLFHLY